jgi:2-keto-4-pentenoate hydratase/2-oxohepta-3-ene-1,7-dioic acid hydratase in catechol pathway
MRIIRFIAEDQRVHHGEDQGDGAAISLSGSVIEGFKRGSARLRVVKLLAPFVPRDIICIGRNYRNAGESAPSPPQVEDHTLEVFLKPSSSLHNPNDPITVPHFRGLDAQLDCEGELAIVIGATARDVSEADAMDCIFGYTIANDITARAFQTPTGPPLWMRGKGFDGFCPLGPAILTRDQISDPGKLTLRTLINGKVVREGNTRDMIRSAPQILAALSRHMTVPAGSVILTGAPPAPPQSLKVGDELAVEVEGLGKLQNAIESPQ